MPKKLKTYEISGYIEFLSSINFEVKAKSIKEARLLAIEKANQIERQEQSFAELSHIHIDKPLIIK